MFRILWFGILVGVYKDVRLCAPDFDNIASFPGSTLQLFSTVELQVTKAGVEAWDRG